MAVLLGSVVGEPEDAVGHNEGDREDDARGHIDPADAVEGFARRPALPQPGVAVLSVAANAAQQVHQEGLLAGLVGGLDLDVVAGQAAEQGEAALLA